MHYKFITNRSTAFLSFIFFFSGFSALIYQVVWQRLLTVHYGVGAISMSLIVSVYMVGLGLGALFGGYLAERTTRRITLYCIVEFLIGAFGLISLPLLSFIGSHTAGSSYVLSLFYMFAFLCLPTFLMGTTLPLLTKVFNRLICDFLGSVSFLYFINTIGAAIGAVFASYLIISFFGLDVAAAIAVLINFFLAALIFLVRDSDSGEYASGKTSRSIVDRDAIFGSSAFLLVFITGFLAIGYEIVWFRIIGVLTKASPYAFSTVLSVYLAGIAIGSFGMNKYLQRHRNIHKKSLFFSLQFLIGVSVVLTIISYYYLTKHTGFDTLTIASFQNDLHPSFKMPSMVSVSQFLIDMYGIVDVFWWPAFFVLIPTIFMGASFPLINLLAMSRSDEEGRTVGTVYFFNITGNVLGGLVTGFLLLPFLGTEMTLLAFSSIGLLFGLFVLNIGGRNVPFRRRVGSVATILLLTVAVFPRGGQLYEEMHTPPDTFDQVFETYLEEGVEGITLAYQQQDKVVNYINGLGHGGRPGYMFYYETLKALGFAPDIESALVIGFGTGSAVEMIQKSDVRAITLVELNETLMNNLSKMPVIEDILSDPRLTIVFDDGRRYLLRTDKKFGLVAMDPLRTTTSYSNNVYSRQFFELVSEHLSEDGVFMLWKDEHMVIPNTVHAVFDYVKVYGFFILASNSPFKEDREREKKILAQFSLAERGHILKAGTGQYIGDQTYFAKQASDYLINEDWKPITEYYLGLKVKNIYP